MGADIILIVVTWSTVGRQRKARAALLNKTFADVLLNDGERTVA